MKSKRYQIVGLMIVLAAIIIPVMLLTVKLRVVCRRGVRMVTHCSCRSLPTSVYLCARVLILLLVAAPLLAAAPAPNSVYFKIMVVDDRTSRGVPLVELRTVNDVRYYTDSNGIVAFYEPGLMKGKVYFSISSPGYEYPADGFGYRGKAVEVQEGGSIQIPIHRLSIAERLYRVTGEGIYRDSLLVGQPAPTANPVLNGMVFGSDSVVNTEYHGKLYWFWGDTNRPSYPLGNFQVTGATSLLPGAGGLNPSAGIDLNYFVDHSGFARPMAPLPGEGPTWIFGLVTLRDQAGQEQMVAAYVKVHDLLKVYQRGLVKFNDEKQQFEKVAQFEMDSPIQPGGQTFKRIENGLEYVYFSTPYPLTRVRADLEQMKELSNYETFTCLSEGSRLQDLRVDRAPDGAIRYGWKKNTPAVGPGEQTRLVQAGKARPEELLLHLQDAETGKPVIAHTGSVYWNNYRKRWILITVESGGTSVLGELWYAEGDTPLGPWVYARKIVTHNRYSFYNPKQHPMFDQENGRVIYFEGTYTQTFSGNPEATPRYDYNQMMYRLDLSDPRLVLPAPIYELPGIPNRPGAFVDFLSTAKAGNSLPSSVHPGVPESVSPSAGRKIAFFALDRPLQGAIPVYAEPGGLSTGSSTGTGTKPEFYLLPPDARDRPAATVPLYQFQQVEGREKAYSTDPHWNSPGFKSEGKMIGFAWRSPISGAFPVQF